MKLSMREREHIAELAAARRQPEARKQGGQAQRFFEYQGQVVALPVLLRIAPNGISRGGFYGRIRAGFTPEEAVTVPVSTKKEARWRPQRPKRVLRK